MTYARQRTLPVLALLLAAGLTTPTAAVHAQDRVDPLAAEFVYGLDRDDPRRAGDADPTGDHPLIDWVVNKIFIVRPSEPGEHRKAELSFSPTDEPGVLTVSRRTLGTMDILYGTARLRRAAGTRFSPFSPRQQYVLLLDVDYEAKDGRGAAGALAGTAEKAAKHYRARYALRANGDVIMGITTAPNVEGEFEEKGLSQGVRYRRAGSLLQRLSEADDAEKKRLEELQQKPVVTKTWVAEFSASGEENTSMRRENFNAVSFYFNPPEEIVSALAIDKPKHIFVIAHGWNNNRELSLDFASNLVLGLRARLLQDKVPEEDVAFVFVSWNSQRLVFMESALCAETIGHREVAPMLKGFKAKLPSASLTLIGHSLGGRMMLATLQGPDKKMGAVGRWKQRQFRKMDLFGRDALDSAFRRMMHLALRGRMAPAPKVDAVVLLEAAIDLNTLHADIGLLNYGDTPNAVENAKIIANAHSRNDDILRQAYTASNGVTNIVSTIIGYLEKGDGLQALGRLGAERSPGVMFPTVKLTGQHAELAAFKKAMANPLARPTNAPANRFINVDVTALLPMAGMPKPDGGTWGKVESHTEIYQPAIFDLIWQVTKLASKGGSAK